MCPSHRNNPLQPPAHGFPLRGAGAEAVEYLPQLSRVNAGWHGGDWMRAMENAHESGAYEMCFCEAGCPRCISSRQPDIREMNFRMLLNQVDEIYSGMMPDRFTRSPKGEAALFYCELNKVSREWFRENICRKPDEHQRIAQVGMMSFYL